MKLEARVERLEAGQAEPTNKVTRIVLKGYPDGPEAISEMLPDGSWTPFERAPLRGARRSIPGQDKKRPADQA